MVSLHHTPPLKAHGLCKKGGRKIRRVKCGGRLLQETLQPVAFKLPGHMGVASYTGNAHVTCLSSGCCSRQTFWMHTPITGILSVLTFVSTFLSWKTRLTSTEAWALWNSNFPFEKHCLGSINFAREVFLSVLTGSLTACIQPSRTCKVCDPQVFYMNNSVCF